MVSLKINIQKKDLWLISAIFVFLVGVGFVIAVATEWDVGKTMFHNSEDVKVTMDSLDYSLQEAIDEGLIGGGISFGSGSKNDNLGSPIVNATLYRVTSDGFLNIENNGAGYSMSIRMGSTSPPPERFSLGGWGGNGGTYPIKSGEYFQVDTDGPLTYIYWQPIGSGEIIKQ